jgi:uroporphyrinogen-III decarboxylase
MTSRQRLLAVLSGQIPDRVPVSCYELVGYDLKSWYNTHSSYDSLMKLIREKTDCLYMAPLPNLPTGMSGDIFDEVTPYSAPLYKHISKKQWKQGKSTFYEIIFHTPKGDLKMLQRLDDDIFTVWTIENLLKDLSDIDKYISFPWQQPDEFDLSVFATTQKNLGENGILLPSIADPICEAAELFELSQFLILSITDTAQIKRLLDFIHARQIANLNAIFKGGVKAGVDWSQVLFRVCGPEYAIPPRLSPEYFANFVTPYVKPMSDIFHQHDAKMRIHSHGCIRKVLSEMMKTNPDALDPIEPLPDGDISLGDVKKLIGDKVCLFGNIELKLLEHGEPAEVRDFVIDAMKQAKKGGRFVMMPTAGPINDPISPKTEENYRVYIETALEYGKY